MPDIVEVLKALAPVLVASGTIVGGLAALVKGAPRVRRLFGVTDQTRQLVLLREQLDEVKELAELRAQVITELRTQLTDERNDRAELTAKLRGDLDFAHRSADDLRRRLSDALSRGD